MGKRINVRRNSKTESNYGCKMAQGLFKKEIGRKEIMWKRKRNYRL